MVKKIAIALLAAGLIVLAGSFSVNEIKTDGPDRLPPSTQKMRAALAGDWDVRYVSVCDSAFVSCDRKGDKPQPRVEFDNEKYYIRTGVNVISGDYWLTGDSIAMNMAAATTLSGDSERVEDLMAKVIPSVNSVELLSDTEARLGTNLPATYILLEKRGERIAGVK